MKRLAFMMLILAALAASAAAQAMNSSNAMSDSTPAVDAGGMMAAPAMGESGSSGEMMSEDMSHQTLEKGGMLADVKMGSQLRMARSNGMKVQYKDLKSAEALAAKNPTVLFFAADWCPSCQADLKDINANGSKLGKVNIVVVDYDKSADLKAKYGITVQDSFVQIDARGARLAIWNGGGVNGILMNLKKGM